MNSAADLHGGSREGIVWHIQKGSTYNTDTLAWRSTQRYMEAAVTRRCSGGGGVIQIYIAIVVAVVVVDATQVMP